MKWIENEECDEALEKTKFIWPKQRGEACSFDGLTLFEESAFHCDLCEGDPQCVSICTNGAILMKP